MKKWLLFALGLAVFLAVIGFSLQTLRTSSVVTGVTEENFRRLCEGMTKKEVEAILNEPSYRFRGAYLLGDSRAEWENNDCRRTLCFYKQLLWRNRVQSDRTSVDAGCTRSLG